jgi:hypothetical protein
MYLRIKQIEFKICHFSIPKAEHSKPSKFLRNRMTGSGGRPRK